jgi:hypothetical protein
MHVEAVAFCSKAALDAYVAVAVENACSETRRNILRLVSGDVVSGLPDQDVVVACAALRVQTERDQRQADALQSALNDAKRARLDKVTAVRDLELREKELLGTIKGRDRTIDRLCRHIAFGAAKP